MIRCHSISKIYDMRQHVLALDGITLDIDKGSIYALTGTSGSGKTTLMNIIGLLDRPSSGTLTIDGMSVADMDDGELSHIRGLWIGFVFQSFHLLNDMSAVDNVALPLIYRGTGSAERNKQAIQALDRVGLSHRINHRPNELSGGQKQRIAIARALVGNPKILLADEPTGNLDSASADDIMTLFQQLNRDTGLTTIIVTHDRAIANSCHYRADMKDGRIEMVVPILQGGKA